MRFSPEMVRMAGRLDTPFFLMDIETVLHQYRQLSDCVAGLEVFYAVKANPHRRVLESLVESGSGFEVSSCQELEAVLAAGAVPNRIISCNPVKSPGFLGQAHYAGVDIFAFDSPAELDKLAAMAPGCRVVARLVVSNAGSEWPLCGKYGVDAGQAIDLMRRAARLGLRPYGLTFHVGSQCLNKENWVDALFLCRQVWDQARRLGIRLELLSLGGGLPVYHGKRTPSTAEIGAKIESALRKLFPSERPRLALEPGRAVVGEAAVLVASVIGRARRGSEEWLYLDAGVFNALFEATQGIAYHVETERKGPRRPFTLAGPSCDSVDTIGEGVMLPNLQVGDRVYIMNAGAYTLSYASCFNGFPPPPVFFVDEV
ncbi:MAG: type III PLP-dependent enzyme [Dehalococcoidia bacterium]|nr:type III PLP-dependent enzyme [Dehalococcoidia bacterium]